MAAHSAEIHCTSCGRDSLLMRSPKYDGFTKVGESLTCSACGHEYEDEGTVPFAEVPQASAVFTDADKSEDAVFFGDGEGQQLCRHCRSYVVNPFTQRCGLHMKTVEATDSCAEFTEKDDEACT